MKKKRNGSGFTLAELLIVVAVIAVLVAVAVPTFSNQLEKSRQAVDISNLRGAYAAAKIAAMDGMVDGEKLNTGDATYFWYNPNDGTLTKAASVLSDVPDGMKFGKAKGTTVLADTSNLPDGITYELNSDGGLSGHGICVSLIFEDGSFQVKTRFSLKATTAPSTSNHDGNSDNGNSGGSTAEDVGD